MCKALPLLRDTGEISTSLTYLTLVRPSSSAGSTKKNIDSLSVKSLSQPRLSNYSDSRAMQEQILAKVKIMQYKLAELVHLLITNGPSVSSKSTDGLTDCTDDEGTH
ncbi:Kita-kyushu lung cancer antigen 1 [Manis javanica]|nr:Kita-kyushu lung cancer antigen 1 [Manis javanica]